MSNTIINDLVNHILELYKVNSILELPESEQLFIAKIIK